MAFPALTPTSRSFESGDFPIKTFKAQNGAETRILYGSNRTNMKLQLSYANITDAEAEQFLDHYEEVRGTFDTFNLGQMARGGWQGNPNALGAQRLGISIDTRNRHSLLRCALERALLQ
jgi:hypothetical protein